MGEKLYVGDPHGGARAYIYEENGARYVSKPRSASTERAWAAFLRGLHVIGMPDLPAAIEPIREDENGAVFPFAERDEDFNYSVSARKFGALCAICDVFGATDLHDENVIFGADGPVLCDLETLLPTIDTITPPAGKSCLTTGLVANFRALRGGETHMTDVSALSNAPFSPRIYKEEIFSAFRRALRFLYSHKAALAPLAERFRGCKARYLLRPTDVYYKICAAAKNRGNPAQYIADSLARAYNSLPESLAPAREYETAALLNAVIPLFYCEANGRDLCADGEVLVRDFFASPPLDILKSRFASLSEDFLRDEEIAFRAALMLTLGEQFVCISHDDVKRVLDENTLSDGQTLKIYADKRGKTLIRSGLGIYGGAAGRAVYFAALCMRGDCDAKARLYTLCEMLRECGENIGLGFADGLGGIIFALYRAYKALCDPAPMRIAAELFERTAIETDERDFYSGAAGTLAVLPLLRGHADDASLRSAAKKLADMLRVYIPEQTGLAHGMAGISLALSAAAQFGEDFNNEICALIEAENLHYDEAAHNWRDIRGVYRDTRGVYIDGICSGAPGICIARKIVAAQTKSDKIRALCESDMSRVRDYCAAFAERRGDYGGDIGTLCCGIPAADLCAVLCGCPNKPADRFAAVNLGLLDGIVGQAIIAAVSEGNEREL